MSLSKKEIMVTKHNNLIEASYKLTLNEQRLISTCIGKLDPRKPLSNNNLIEITAREFSERYEIDEKTSYRDLENASKELYERDIKTYDGKYRERFRWVYYVKYHDGEGRVTMGFSPHVIPYLTMLHQRFTSYQLNQISGLKHVSSIRLFEFLMQFKTTGKFIIDLDKFKERLGLEKDYKRFFDLKRRVIDPAVKELKEKSNLLLSWKGIKGSYGKAIKQLEFVFKEENIIDGATEPLK